MSSLILIAHNLRSAHNVGSLLRTAEGLGVTQVYLTGYTPYPLQASDSRLPHLANKIDRQINKTALGAEKSLGKQASLDETLANLRTEDFLIAGLEQTHDSVKLTDYVPPEKLAIIVGREVEGIESEALDQCDLVLEIPMKGKKESFNVAQAAAIAMYHCQMKSHNL